MILCDVDWCHYKVRFTQSLVCVEGGRGVSTLRNIFTELF